ncbi:MAG: hypothetical protein ALECFALPRED_001672 [Alectoria fallacina]|uniref:Uncharacterized protein n=1 Tax=Alectoria fallacina TaxID=1903189 RepID=A0A8H3FFG9_9LECA|nr:MAG: hypothetical protein ALECFALPRED_001672 [Alectoria fallacina]
MAEAAAVYSSFCAQIAIRHDVAYYEKWNRERQEAVARGEDPNAKFLALVAQKEATSTGGGS